MVGYLEGEAEMKLFTLLLLPLILLACMTTAPLTATPEATATSTPTIAPVSVNKEIRVDTCRFVAVTETNIRECGDVSCRVVGMIDAGETVTGVCSDSEWVTLGANQFACIPALIGTGGCE